VCNNSLLDGRLRRKFTGAKHITEDAGYLVCDKITDSFGQDTDSAELFPICQCYVSSVSVLAAGEIAVGEHS